MHRPTRLKITDLNPHFTCILCCGYFVDATTIVECLHSFCRACIVRHLETTKFCPVCDVQVHKTKPLLSIRSDKTLQDVVYKLVPGLYQNEMKRRREFYADHPEAASRCTSEERGEGENHRFIYTPDETISLSLEYGTGEEDGRRYLPNVNGNEEKEQKVPQRRYLQCPAAVTVGHLKKFVNMKYGLPSTYRVDISYSGDPLNEGYTLMDIAYIYAWRRSGPMRFFYKICKQPKKIKTTHPVTDNSSTSAAMLDITERSSSNSENKELCTDVPHHQSSIPVQEVLKIADNEKDESQMAENAPAISEPVIGNSSPVKPKDAVLPQSSTAELLTPLTSQEVTTLKVMETELKEVNHVFAEKVNSATSPAVSNGTIASAILTQQQPITTQNQIISVCSNTPYTASFTPVSSPNIPSISTDKTAGKIRRQTRSRIKTSSSVNRASRPLAKLAPYPSRAVKPSSVTTLPSQGHFPSSPVTCFATPTGTCLTTRAVNCLGAMSVNYLTPGHVSCFTAPNSLNGTPTINTLPVNANTPTNLPMMTMTNRVASSVMTSMPLPPSTVTSMPATLPSVNTMSATPATVCTIPAVPSPVSAVLASSTATITNTNQPQMSVNNLVPSTVNSFAVAHTSVPSTSLPVSNTVHVTEMKPTLKTTETGIGSYHPPLPINNGTSAVPAMLTVHNVTKEMPMVTVSAVEVPSLASVTSSVTTVCTTSAVITTASLCTLSITTPAPSKPVISKCNLSKESSAVSSANKRSPSVCTSTPSMSFSVSNLVPNIITQAPRTDSSLGFNQKDAFKAHLMFTDSSEPKVVPPQEISNTTNQNVSPLKDIVSPQNNSINVPFKEVKSSITAEFSDNDDLGCQPDLVVDEQKLDSSDNEDEGDDDDALRRKITAIAEKDDEADIETDSGRASDISNQARSSCDDDLGSPMPIVKTPDVTDKTSCAISSVTVTSSCQPAPFVNSKVSTSLAKTLPPISHNHVPVTPILLSPQKSTDPNNSNVPSSKSGEIDRIINNLHKNHEKKDTIGALDLSTSSCRNGDQDERPRPRQVANPPVLDAKHRQPTCLSAPPTKPHTPCAPAPKHPTSTNFMIGLSASVARHGMLAASQAHTNKIPSIRLPQQLPFHHNSSNSPSQILLNNPHGTAKISPPSNAHHVCRNQLPNMNSNHHTSPTSPLSNHLQIAKGTLPNSRQSNCKSTNCRSPTALSTSPSSLSYHRKSPLSCRDYGSTITSPTKNTSPRHLNSNMSPPNPTASPRHRSSPCVTPPTSNNHNASPVGTPSSHLPILPPVPSPSTYKINRPSIPIYKKSESSSNSSFKNSFNRFKGSNLTADVINPDSNGYSPKIVIKNLDSRSNNRNRL